MLRDRRAANALGREVWQQVESWLYREFGTPHTKHPGEREMAWGNDLNGGLVLKRGGSPAEHRVVWSTQAINRSRRRLGRKRLSLALDWSCLSGQRRAYALARLGTLRRVGISREVVRGRAVYWAHLCLDCPPYRSAAFHDRLAARPQDETLGLDMGPTEQAWVTGSDAGAIRLGEAVIARARQARACERRRQRALDRSRRAMNPDCYDDQGRSIRGKRPRRLSRRGQRFAAAHREDKRKSGAQRKAATIAQAQRAALLAPVVYVEDQKLRSWQATYGKRMALTLPGLFLARLDSEQQLAGGLVERLPLRSAFSQYCLCGEKVKKPRSQNWHRCENSACPIYAVRLDRHRFSAWLMRITASPEHGGIPALHEGTLASSLAQTLGAPGLQESLRCLCGYRSRGRAKHPEGGIKLAPTRRRGSEGAAGRIAHTAKPTQALPDGAHACACMPKDVSGNAALLVRPTRSGAAGAYPR